MTSPIIRRRALPAFAALAAACAGGYGRAGVVVMTNRGPDPVSLAVMVEGAPPRSLALEPGDARPIFADAPVKIRIGDAATGRVTAVDPGVIYAVTPTPADGGAALVRIPLKQAHRPSWSPPDDARLATMPVAEIQVKILVDDDEYRPRSAWETAIRERVERASAIFEAHAGMRLRVVAADTWDSDDSQQNFFESLAEFEREVHPGLAQVAIGFSSQYAITRGRVHMGGTRGPLHSHILIKERANNILETERLELLVHELGHFMGATHSPQARSVMRPVIGQGRQRAAGARIQFDAPNTLVMSLLGEEIRRRGIREISAASPSTLRRMGEIYAALEPTTPNDPATGYIRRLIASAGVRPVIEDTRRVLGQIVRVAKLRRQLSAQDAGGNGESPAARPPGAQDKSADDADELTEFYVRQAALAAKQVRREHGPRALLIALGVAVDDPAKMVKIPLAGPLLAQLEGASQQAQRVAAVGEPTMRGRLDMTRHFFVTAQLAAMSGTEFARGLGVAKEVSDSNGGSGFSFADIAANEAGLLFAAAVMNGRLSLDDVSQRFTVDAYLPPVADLREGMQATEFQQAFGGVGDPRYAAEMARIHARLADLPGYAPMAPGQ